jgi:hypothetical protein
MFEVSTLAVPAFAFLLLLFIAVALFRFFKK